MIFTPYILPLLLSAIIMSGIALYVRRFQAPVVRPFIILMVIAVYWALSYALTLSASVLPLKIFFSEIQFLPLPFLGPIILALALEYTGHAQWLTRRRLVLLLVVPILTILIVLTSGYHTLFRYNYSLGESDPFPLMAFTEGPWFWVHYAYSFGVGMAGIVILVASFRTRTLYFRHTLLLMLGLELPLVTDVLFHLNITPVRGLDFAAMTFIVTALIFWWAILREGMFNVAPIARHIVVDNIDDIVVVLDTHDHIVDYNPAALATCKFSPRLIGASPDALPPEWAALFRRYRDQANLKDQVTVGTSEQARVYDLTLSTIRDEHNRTLGRLFIFHDLTELEHAQAAREERLQFEQLLSELSATFVSVPVEQVGQEIEHWLKRIAQFLQVDRSSIMEFLEDERAEVTYSYAVPGVPSSMGMTQDQLPWYTLHLRQGNLVRVQVGEDFPPQASFEREYRARIGMKSHLALPLKVGGNLVGAIGWSTFQAERTWPDELIQRLTLVGEVLANAIQRRRAESALVRARDAAETANRAKSTFLANMSHELRTPLNAILGYIQILQRDSTMTDYQQERLGIIRKSGEHLLTLLNDVLDLSRIEAGRMDLQIAEFHLPHFLQDLVDIFRERAANNGLGFRYHAPADLPSIVVGDEKRLRQVLINLLGNAVKFTASGEVRFAVGYEQGRFQFQVQDTGPGIPPEERETIFLPFRQGKGASSGAEGSGLGLAISQRLVDAMDGELHVDSTVGQGATFWGEIGLPIGENQSATLDEHEMTIVAYQGPKRKLLVVDDNRENRAVLCDLLAPLGFEILEATDAQTAIDQIQTIEPALILMDLVMPEMDGLEATRRIRALALSPRPVIIGISASAFERDRQQSFDAGCDAFIAKPFKVEQLLDLLQQHLQLEWVYTTRHSTEGPISEVRGLIVFPPKEELTALEELARLGDIQAIRQRADELARNTQWAPFAAEVNRLAKGFLIDQIRKLLKSQLDGKVQR